MYCIITSNRGFCYTCLGTIITIFSKHQCEWQNDNCSITKPLLKSPHVFALYMHNSIYCVFLQQWGIAVYPVPAPQPSPQAAAHSQGNQNNSFNMVQGIFPSLHSHCDTMNGFLFVSHHRSLNLHRFKLCALCKMQQLKSHIKIKHGYKWILLCVY